MPRDGFPCACWYDPYLLAHQGKCEHHDERDRLEAERGEQGPRERDYPNAAAYHGAFRRWRDEHVAHFNPEAE